VRRSVACLSVTHVLAQAWRRDLENWHAQTLVHDLHDNVVLKSLGRHVLGADGDDFIQVEESELAAVLGEKSLEVERLDHEAGPGRDGALAGVL
jgi:predicted hydrolase (HD superfamily)